MIKDVNPSFELSAAPENPDIPAMPEEPGAEETPGQIQAEAAAYVEENGDDPAGVFGTAEASDKTKTTPFALKGFNFASLGDLKIEDHFTEPQNGIAPLLSLMQGHEFTSPRNEFVEYDYGQHNDPTPQEIKASIERGVMPSVGYGWSFVIDRRPEGEEDQHIPSKEYTAYFAERQIPIADTDHADFDHDVMHVPSYQRMFGIKGFGEMVQQAAANVLDDPELCAKFTGAIDGIGDTARNFEGVAKYQPGDDEMKARIIGYGSSARREFHEPVKLRELGGERLSPKERSSIGRAFFSRFNIYGIEQMYGIQRS